MGRRTEPFHGGDRRGAAHPGRRHGGTQQPRQSRHNRSSPSCRLGSRPRSAVRRAGQPPDGWRTAAGRHGPAHRLGRETQRL
ncbi:hypothetical protein CU044_7584 [Streptomyces sp. L-9-10]|nr:hypothetical protein CU044_7584 [Streptomyces sp. L-9-10]